MKPAAVLFALSSMTALAVATPLPPGEWDSSDVYFFDDINFEGNIFTFPALMRDGECAIISQDTTEKAKSVKTGRLTQCKFYADNEHCNAMSYVQAIGQESIWINSVGIPNLAETPVPGRMPGTTVDFRHKIRSYKCRDWTPRPQKQDLMLKNLGPLHLHYGQGSSYDRPQDDRSRGDRYNGLYYIPPRSDDFDDDDE